MLRPRPTPRPAPSPRPRVKIVPLLSAPAPPDAMVGVEGMRQAERILKELGAVGLLIGGLARELWRGVNDPSILSSHKDVDVLLLHRDCQRHPSFFQGGIDWWMAHGPNERPTNGYPVGLIGNFCLKSKTDVTAGLYLCPQELLVEGLRREAEYLKKEVDLDFNQEPADIGIPLLDASKLNIYWLWFGAKIARGCRRGSSS